jgi:hypothetical protein
MIRRLLIFLWCMWDVVYSKCSRLKHVKKGQNIFRVVVKRYRGEEIRTSDGYTLKPGDWYAQLHLHNARLAKLLQNTPKREFAWALTLTKTVRDSLPDLARFVACHPMTEHIQVLLGTTFLDKGSKQLGFEVTPIPSSRHKRLKSLSVKAIFLLCHPNGWEEIRRRKNRLVPKRVFISKEKLKHVYGAGM